MKVLLLHSEDVPWGGAWTDTQWDLIVDLAFAGPNTYEEWSRQCGAPVRSIHEFAGDGQSYTFVRDALDFGRNRLVDRVGLDWWEIIGVVNYHELQALYLVQCLSRELGSHAMYQATQQDSFSKLLSSITGRSIPSFKAPSSRMHSWRRSLRAAMKLTPASFVEIAFDKWDPAYSMRRHVTRSRRGSLGTPAVLLPSAYSNVTRLLLQYAADLPQRSFLLAATRSSGTASSLPLNVSQTLLSAYAQPFNASEQEENELKGKWAAFESNLLDEFEVLRWSRDSGVWKSFPDHLRTGLCLRNAWLALLQVEPITGVLCADDLNYYTRIPLILAVNMGLNAVYCYHGALDGGLLFKRPYAGHYLVKSEMEKDYMLRCSEIERERIEIAAPLSYLRRLGSDRGNNESGDIVFFSQPYEVLAGRTVEIYRDVLPRLCALGKRTGRKVVLKLHPFESTRGRKRVLRSVLTSEEMSIVHVAEHSSLDAVLASAWCGIGVDSSVAAECCSAGMLYFLCGWLDYSGFDYSRQLARFGAGQMLEDPSQLGDIPEMIANRRESRAQQLCKPIDADLLDRILFTSCEVSLKQCAS